LFNQTLNAIITLLNQSLYTYQQGEVGRGLAFFILTLDIGGNGLVCEVLVLLGVGSMKLSPAVRVQLVQCSVYCVNFLCGINVFMSFTGRGIASVYLFENKIR
jgi:hypothetical protein